MISVYCSETLDGVAAAAIVMRHAMLAKLPSHFGGFLHPDRLEDELKDMAGSVQNLIFVVDVCIHPNHLPFVELVEKKNKLVYWNSSSSECVIPPAKIVDRATEKKCSAELACDRFLPKDLIAKQLARLAREVKFWQLEDVRAQKLSDLIAAQYSPVELLSLLSKGILWNEQLEQVHKEYGVKKEAALEELMRSLTIKTYLSHRFGYAYASSVLISADACQRILDGHAGVDVAVVLYRDGRIVFRRRDGESVDVKSLAELFGGGGHPFAAGARLKYTIKKESFSEVVFRLDQSFRKFFVGSA